MLTIQECAESIVTRLFSVCWCTEQEEQGERIAIKQK